MPADQLDHPALRLLAQRPELFARQGHVAAGWRYRDGRRFGPYYRLSYRLDDRQHSIYLGRAGEFVDRVRQQLESLQRPLVERRAVRRLERQVRAALRIEKLHLNALLRPYGLRLKGFQVRGWRHCTFRRFLPRRRCLLPRFSPLKPVTSQANREPAQVLYPSRSA
jgi:hypothetical protein